jgi:hydrogenase expression/formation protein HypE
MNDTIRLGHGSGGRLSHDLIRDVFYKRFSNDLLDQRSDAACLPPVSGDLAFTTDGHVVQPLFFPGGSIGTLAVCGTVNDLAVTGARPRWLSASFIIEEGFSRADLERVVDDMAASARKAGVTIVTGDTKVVEKGACDGLFISTAGVGEFVAPWYRLQGRSGPRPGDVILVNGSIGDHGIAVMTARNGIETASPVESDCMPLNGLVEAACESCAAIGFARDATRGGLATVLVELADQYGVGVALDEASFIIDERVNGLCELLGFDPLYLANEGKVVLVVPENDAEGVLKAWSRLPGGERGRIIGRITNDHPGRTVMNTAAGGRRVVDMLSGEQLPRIC